MAKDLFDFLANKFYVEMLIDFIVSQLCWIDIFLYYNLDDVYLHLDRYICNYTREIYLYFN